LGDASYVIAGRKQISAPERAVHENSGEKKAETELFAGRLGETHEPEVRNLRLFFLWLSEREEGISKIPRTD